MLGNVVPLWETMLAAMKLGAVVIPATTLLTPDDLRDRFERGARALSWSPRATDAAKFAGLDRRRSLRIVVGAARRRAGLRYERCGRRRRISCRTGATARRRSDAAVFHLRHHGEAEAGAAQPRAAIRSAHLSTMYWLGLQPGDVHLNISSPGWAKHAWSCFFAPWNAGATVFIANQPRFDARGLLDAIADNGVTTLCAPPTVWRHVHPGGSARLEDAACARCAAPASRSTPK